MIPAMTEGQNDFKKGQKKELCEWFAFVSPHFLQQSDFNDVLILECTFGVTKTLVCNFHENSLKYLDLWFYEFLCTLTPIILPSAVLCLDMIFMVIERKLIKVFER